MQTRVATVNEHELTIRPAQLTREYIEFQMAFVRLEAEDMTVADLALMVHKRVVDSITARELVEKVGADGIYALAMQMAAGNAMPTKHLQGIKKLLYIAYKAQDFDPHFDPPCECLKCKGETDEDQRCLYNFDRPKLCDMLANHDWDLLSECWEQPFYVYQMRNEVNSASARGSSAMYQVGAKERAKKEEAANIQQKHLGTKNWHDVAKQRGL